MQKGNVHFLHHKLQSHNWAATLTHTASARTFATGLIFFYWDAYHPKLGMKQPRKWVDMLQTNSYSGHAVCDLFVDGARWRNLKEEAVESGHCSLAEFEDLVVLKAAEYAHTDRVKKVCQN